MRAVSFGAVLLPPEQSLEFTLSYHLILESAEISVQELFQLIEKRCEVEQ